MTTLQEIYDMLRVCAEGSEVVEKTHNLWVLYHGKTYVSLPRGAHGRARTNLRAEIPLGQVKKMVRFLLIDEVCASHHIDAWNPKVTREAGEQQPAR